MNMKWSLEIHHLDINCPGDATIIIACGTATTGEKTYKTVLIDGGKETAGNIIHSYLKKRGIAKVDVIAITHYDEDHYNGITALLGMTGTTLYDNTIIYDAGEPPENEKYFAKNKKKRRKGGNKSDYEWYIDAVSKKTAVIRATKKVNSFDIVNYDSQNKATIPRGIVDGFLDPAWLVGKEIMWGNGGDGLAGRPNFVSNPPMGAPTITCIAANKYVRQCNGSVRFVSNVNIYDGPDRIDIAAYENKNDNAKSLGFLLTFNNFRYYVAGDLESPQEDGHNNVNTNPVEFQPGVKKYVNPGDTMSSRVLAMKTSHHGSISASSLGFIQQLRPSSAIISCGPHRRFLHPSQGTINILDGYPATPDNSGFKNQNRHPLHPPPSPYNGVYNYLTAFFNPDKNPPLSFGGDVSLTAGDPANNKPGHILLTVSEEQSKRPVEGQVYRGILAAADQTMKAAGIVVNAKEIAEKGAVFGPVGAVITAVNAPLKAAEMALKAAAFCSNRDSEDLGVMSAALKAKEEDLDPDEISEKAKEGDNADRVKKIGKGAEVAIGYSVYGADSKTIANKSISAGVNDVAARAAGWSAYFINKDIREADGAGYAAVAAIGAVTGGADQPQAAAVAAAIGATAANAEAYEVAAAIVNSAANAGMNINLAAVAAAAASAAYCPQPVDVENAVISALKTAGFDQNKAKTAGLNARKAATLNPNDLFNIKMVAIYKNNDDEYDSKVEDYPHYS
ncbi:MAG: MBL fold metallo-hydrolase [Acidobacteria bacterium]|nr:MBL fold metallo-hydrolase [Acidobacteriota bacterium]